MSKFNFDPDYFRRVISQCDETEKIPPLWLLVKEAIEEFYDEYDYYPDIGVFAPGVFTIMGEHLEYLEGNLVQAALPFATVIVGKALNSVKCKVVTTATDVDGLKRMVFPINYFKRDSLKVFPPWLTYIKGVIVQFPFKEIRGFDVLIHSNVPHHPGCGRSAALQVAFFTFLQNVCTRKAIKSKERKGELCRQAELFSQKYCNKIGQWCNITSSVAEGSKGVIINCEKHEISTFHLKDINILFLLTHINFDLETDDRDLISQRTLELQVAASLLGLKHIKFAKEKHLEILENMEEPSRETVESILRSCNISEECIATCIDELFNLAKEETVFEEQLYIGEDDVYSQKTRTIEYEKRNEVSCPTCLEPSGFIPAVLPPQKEHPMDYIHKKVAELCEGKTGSRTSPVTRICEKIECPDILENLSMSSNKTVMGKLLKRVRHVITEKLRCKDIPDLVKQGDYVEMGIRLVRSHLSLKIDCEVSCPTLDDLVTLAMETEGVYGSKMLSGGGTLTLLHRSAVEKFIKKIKAKYGPRFRFYSVFPSPGADVIKLKEKKNEKSVLSASYLNKTEIMKRAVKAFESTFKHKPTHGAFAPCVLNFLGDHADYNHGFTISMATSIVTVVVGAFNCTSKIRIATSLNVGEEPSKVSFFIPDVHEVGPGNVHWAKLIRGIIVHFKGSVKGFDCLIDGNLPSKAKIPNSSALTLSFYTFLEELFCEKTANIKQKAANCMFAEHEFLSLIAGTGNHIAGMRAKEDYIIYLDCKSLKVTYLPFQDLSYCIVITFTGTILPLNRALLFSRCDDCYKVAKSLGAKSLRCLQLKNLEAIEPGKVSEKAIKRAKHVILENERALRCAEAIKNTDFYTMGELMVESHNSLRDNYEISNEELHELVKFALEVDGVLGSKMSGSEDASYIITLVNRWAVDDLIEYLQDNYTGELENYIVTTHECCGPLNVKEYVETLTKSQMIFENIFTG